MYESVDYEIQFPVDTIEKISKYNCTLDIKGCSTINEISNGQTVDIPVGTYQYFAAFGSDYSYREGVIFRIVESNRGNRVSALYHFINNKNFDDSWCGGRFYDTTTYADSVYSDTIMTYPVRDMFGINKS